MQPETIEVGKALSPIIVAVIGAIAGLLSGILASLIAPWVHHAIESKRKAIEYKEHLLRDTRKLIDEKSTIVEIKRSSLWGFIDENLNEEERKVVLPSYHTITITEGPDQELNEEDYRKIGISKMVSRLEKEWHLTKT